MTVDFPLERVGRRGAAPNLAHLRNVLVESAELLEASRTSDDEDLRVGSIELAIRTLRVTSRLIEKLAPEHRRGPASVLPGPWLPAESGS
ncbi:MAG: hypothetical protein ACREPA_11740 [Candidatus Dormibacteraceae bacterium]